jgi:hypothetical protein
MFFFHISIEDSKPVIWRKLRVPGSFTLGDLHEAVQIAFGWTDSHLHSFTVNSVEYMKELEPGMEIYHEEDVLREDDYRLDGLGLREKQNFSYLYDFGDSWEHRITVSKITPLREGDEPEPPLCLDGKYACPLEDSGGVWGYAGILDAMKDPGNAENEDILEWAGDFDPLEFDLDSVNRVLKKVFPPARKAAPGRAKKGKAGGSKEGSPGGEKKTGQKEISGPKEKKKKAPARKKGPPDGKLKKLCALMNRVKEMKPWEELWDSEFVLIELPGREEPVLCSVMGRDGQYYGIGVYPGFDSIFSLIRLTGEEGHPFVSLGYQNWFLCQLGERNDLFPEERERLKELGISFRGKHDWALFRKALPGLLPWYINSSDADLLIEALGCFIDAYSVFAGGGLAVDFDAGQVLIHRYSEKEGKWITSAGKMPPVPSRYNEITVDAAQVEPLRFKKQTKTVVEADVLYFPQVIGENKDGFPVLMRVLVLMNNRTRLILDQRFTDPDEKDDSLLIDMLFSYIGSHDRPGTIMVRDQFAAATLEDFCKKIDVDLVHSKGMPAVDGFVQEWTASVRPRR